MTTALDTHGLVCRWCPTPATGYVPCWDATGTADEVIGVCDAHRPEVVRCGYVVLDIST